MRCLARNKSPFWYALYEGKEPIQNGQGYDTGEYEIVRSNPQPFTANISAAKGETESMQFGENVLYDKTIVMDDEAPNIDEYSVLWIDTVPQLNEDGSLATDEDGEIITPHDYVVKKVAKSLNSVSLAISKVIIGG